MAQRQVQPILFASRLRRNPTVMRLPALRTTQPFVPSGSRARTFTPPALPASPAPAPTIVPMPIVPANTTTDPYSAVPRSMIPTSEAWGSGGSTGNAWLDTASGKEVVDAVKEATKEPAAPTSETESPQESPSRKWLWIGGGIAALGLGYLLLRR